MMHNQFKKSPELDIPVTTNYNSKFIIFHEMVKFLHDFLSTSLMMRKNYYESLVTKIDELSEFYKSTATKKEELHSKDYHMTVDMLEYKDTIDKLQAQIEDKTQSIKRKESNIQDLNAELKVGFISLQHLLI